MFEKEEWRFGGLGGWRNLIYPYLINGFGGCWWKGRVCGINNCMQGMVRKVECYVLEEWDDQYGDKIWIKLEWG